LISNSFRPGQGDGAVLLIRVSNVRLVEICRLCCQNTSLSPTFIIGQSLTSFEGILIFSTRLVGNLDATSALVRILKEIDIRALVESVVPGLYVLRAIKVVNVCKPS
jgi:hypothetical protein